MSWLDDFMLGHRRLVVGTAVGAAAVCAALLPLLHFDFNPIHLRSPKAESVATLLDLMKDPNQSPNTLEVLRPTLAGAQALGAQAARLPQVSGVRTLADFVPARSGRQKLAIITDASTLLDLTLDPIDHRTGAQRRRGGPEPRRHRRRPARRRRQAGPRRRRRPAAGRGPGLAGQGRHPPPARRRLPELIAPLNTELDQIRGALAAQPVTLQSLPPDIVQRLDRHRRPRPRLDHAQGRHQQQRRARPVSSMR